MPDSKESQAKHSRNAADLLLHFHEEQAQRDENRVEVGAVYEHVLEDISQRPARFSFSRDEILNGVDEAWPHITEYICDMDVSHATLEKDELDTLDERIQELEARLLSLQPNTTTGDQSITATSTTNISSSDVSPHPLNPSFQNCVQVPEKRPDYWSLYMWNTVKEWHTSPMSTPNALRDDHNGYFLEEDIDVTVWISKVSVDISHSAFMDQMKAVFGSHDNFDTAFSGFDRNLLRADHKAKM
ncbi:hypothetical protein M422DRAFT_263863 [Sphaerobolus stellatus SS14]|uniref:Uncharacterized protein n=1 Tax=Sphaerobolus stellatus (strain SS14) TaxID=990650 RepID=A0A0C9V9B6_SPHS4|nr:hypothetical protein M422DRAFT_263863 [Sphaerobolus stellatus SS14]